MDKNILNLKIDVNKLESDHHTNMAEDIQVNNHSNYGV